MGWSLLVHLRLPFQLALSAVFLWGVLCAGARFDLGTLAGWIAFTVGLSGGATAFNSYYDRDIGPVGGLRRPPPVVAALLPFSLAVIAAGLPLAWLGGGAGAALVYVAAALLFLLYSHPRARLKRHPWLSMGTVALASGFLCFVAGVLCAAGPVPPPAWPVAAGAAASILFIAGFYPLTQLGQIDEDRQRGDRTYAVVHGRGSAFRWAAWALPLAAALDVAVAGTRLGPHAAAGLALGLAVLAARGWRWRGDPALDAAPIADGLVYGAAALHGAVVLVAAVTWARGAT
jgi:4-hydroxybenzoate polyprenyltransferase